ncbi:MAG: DMT family transporter [Nanoarchaeota archaeon]|nr:DMT family transporter [Nanoarchaeota archaeon]
MDAKRGLLLVLGTAIISGISIYINKFSVTAIEPDTFNFLKNITVALLILATLGITKEYKTFKTLTKKQWLTLVIIGFVGGAVPFLLFFKGLTMTSAAMGAFLHKTMFIYVAFLALFFLKEKINKKIILPAILLLIGNALLLKITNMSFGTGELLILAATLLWATENILSKKLLTDLPGNIVSFGRMFFGALFISIYLLATGKLTLITTLTGPQYLWIGFTALLLYLFVTSYYNGLKYINVTTATSILLLGSPITTLLNTTFTSAPLALPQIAGILTIILGIASMIYILENITQTQQHTHNETTP